MVIVLTRTWRRRTVAAILALVVFVLLFRRGDAPGSSNGQHWRLASFASNFASSFGRSKESENLSSRDAAGNATLGFQQILALSRGTPWRVDGLRVAAAKTGINIESRPFQKPVPEKRLASFLDTGPSDLPRPGVGSATAWLGHLDVLQRVVDNGLTTALIMEDDADWDVAIKEQMRDVSDNVRKLYADDRKGIRSIMKHTSLAPYGTGWDILWCGHCGDDVGPAIKAKRNGKDVALEIWHDRTVIPRSRYLGWAHNAVAELPGFSRAAQPAEGPVCTFAYAVTREAAAKVIELAGNGTARAFDVKLASLCLDRSLRCITITPELFHEYVPPSSHDGRIASEVNAANGEGTIIDQDDTSTQQRLGSTANIVKSARCKALFDSTCVAYPLTKTIDRADDARVNIRGE